MYRIACIGTGFVYLLRVGNDPDHHRSDTMTTTANDAKTRLAATGAALTADNLVAGIWALNKPFAERTAEERKARAYLLAEFEARYGAIATEVFMDHLEREEG